MKKSFIKKIFLYIVLLWGINMGMLAQKTAYVTMNFNVPDSKAVFADNTYYTMVGDHVSYTVQVDPTEPIGTMEHLSYTFNGQTFSLAPGDYALEANNTLTLDLPLEQEMTSAAFSIEMKYITAKNETIDALGECPNLITVLPTIVAPQCISSEKKYLTSSAPSITIGAQTAGTGGGTWVYSWSNGVTEQLINFNPATATVKATTDLTLTITNLAPDNKTEWYKETENYSIYVYDSPDVQPHSIADDLHFYKQLPDGNWSVDVIGGGSTIEYHWYLDGTEVDEKSNQFNPKTVVDNAIEKHTVKLMVVTYADDNKELWSSGELFNEEYTIYPVATLSADRLTKSVYLGESVTFSPTYNNGGYSGGNVYQWSGDAEGKSKDLTVTPASVGTYTYTLQASNNYGNVVWESFAPQTYTLNVYQIPSTAITENIHYSNDFEGAQTIPDENYTCTLTHEYKNAEGNRQLVIDSDVVDISVENRNGSEQWTYSVTDNGNLLSAPYRLPQTIGNHQLVISVVNGEGEVETPFRAEFKRSYQIYETPSANRTAGYNEAYETCGGRQIPMSITIVGGHDGGWQYQWKKDGTDIANATSTTYTDNIEYVTSGDADMKNYTIGANATYTLNGKRRLDTTIPFRISYWPMPQNISDFSIKDLQNEKNQFDGTSIDGATRVGNTLQFSVDRAVGGYGNPSVWSYIWRRDGAEIQNYTTTNGWKSSFDETVSYDIGINKGYKDVEYTLRVSNYQNGTWSDNTMSKTIRVYNRPETPTSLKKKGSGASGTMVATTGLTDTQLEGRQYFLVFGYEDAEGNEVKSFEKQQSNPGNTRFEANFSASEVNNSNNRFFVYALWKYDNAVAITSGKCYVDGADEDWDGSNFVAVTRSVLPESATGIDDTPSSTMVDAQRVYTINGQLVKNSQSLPSGIYIIETITNGQRSTKKIVVK